jgi:hypothetical protein
LDTPNLSDDSESLYEVIGLCGSFLTIREHVVYFVHQSVREYLIEHAESEIFPDGHAEGHRKIVSRSLEAMSTTLRKDIYSLQDPGCSIEVQRLLGFGPEDRQSCCEVYRPELIKLAVDVLE